MFIYLNYTLYYSLEVLFYLGTTSHFRGWRTELGAEHRLPLPTIILRLILGILRKSLVTKFEQYSV